MDAPTEEERLHAQSCYAVALHLEAIKKSSLTAQTFIGIGIAAAAYFKNVWILGGAVVLSIVAHFVIIQSCHRFIARSIGMPWDTVAFFYRKYKSDPEFVRDVNKLANGVNRFL